MLNYPAFSIAVASTLFMATSLLGETTLTGDHSVVAGTADTGSLSVQGNLDVAGPTTTFGTTATSDVGLELTYEEAGTVTRILTTATRATAEYLWRQNGETTPADKMTLGANNSLTLFDSSGTARITLKPVEGEIALSGAGGLRLADGTLLSGAASLRSTALYNAAGQVVASVDASGKINFANGLTVGTGPTAAIITPNSVAYLNQTLANFGFRETPVAATAVKTIPINNEVTVTAVTQNSDFVYVVGTVGSGYGLIGSAGISPNHSFVAKLTQTGVLHWVRTIGGAAYISSVAVDSSGNVIAAGYFVGATTGFSSPAANLTANGGSDAFVVKYNAAGQSQWAQRVGGAYYDAFSSVTVDAGGNVVVVGHFAGTTTGLTSPAANLIANSGNSDAFVVKYSPTGQSQWAQRVGGVSGDSFKSVTVDAAGNIVAAGSFAGTTTGLTSPAANLISNTSNSDAFVVKYSPTGQSQWAQRVGGVGGDNFNSVAVDSAGSVIVAGWFAGTTTGLSSPATNLVANGGNDALVVKYNSTGQSQWAQRVGGASLDNFNSVKLDAAGNVIAAGVFSGTTTGLSSPASNVISSGLNTDSILVAYSPAGQSLWATAVGNSGYDYLYLADIVGTKVWTWGQVVYGAAVSLGDTRVDGNFLAGWTALPLVTPNATPSASLAWGGSQAQNNGVALGSSAYASASGSVALGSGTANGTHSFAAGQSDASGAFSTALGNGSRATGHSSLAGGGSVLASGYASFAFGDGTVASGTYSFAFGDYSSASAELSIAMGNGSSASGYTSTALGGSLASGDFSTALGNSTASGAGSTALGNGNAHGDISTAMGSTFAQAFASTVIGRLNVVQGNSTAWIATDDLFVIGNSNGIFASNALVVHKNGNTRVAGTVEAKGGFRTPPMGDIGMGSFTAGNNPNPPAPDATGLNAGLRYPAE
jgi:hypothetical protein